MKTQILIAKAVVAIVPAGCPFTQALKIGNQQIEIPPLCKLNPFYDNLMALRFWALCLLSQE